MSIEEIERKITLCSVFADRKCPHRLLLERLYLFPQILTPEQLEDSENLCCACTEYSHFSKKRKATLERTPGAFDGKNRKAPVA